MKDYSKVKYVKPSVDGTDITKDKVYEFEFDFESVVAGWVKSNVGQNLYIYIPKCGHLGLKKWIPCDKDGNEIEI